MDQKTYLKDRIDDQIEWYSKKSTFFKNRFKLLKVIVIICSVTLPFLVALITGENYTLKIIAGILGVVIAGVEGILSLNKYQDLWLKYRLTAEMLQREKILFSTQSGPYQNNKSAFKLFVQRAESIMSSENQAWIETQQQEDNSQDESKA